MAKAVLKVEHIKSDDYQVRHVSGDVVFKGSLADCESYIRLREAGHINSR